MTPTPKIEVKTIPGKPFSVERYYMLSQIEQQALPPVYLDDHPYNEPDLETIASDAHTANTVASYESSAAGLELPAFPVLYLLWDLGGGSGSGDGTRSSVEDVAESFRRGPLDRALRKLRSLSARVAGDGATEKPSPKSVYVVIDAQIWGGPQEDDRDAEKEDDNDADDDRSRRERFERHLGIVEALARTILLPLDDDDDDNGDGDDDSSSGNGGGRIRVVGATLGLADHARAAPGLEACLDAIQLGEKNRRIVVSERTGNDKNDSDTAIEKSCIGIVSHSLQDLIGYDEETETDAVQGVMQSLTHASSTSSPEAGTAGGTGGETEKPSYRPPIMGYARDAHRHWRVKRAGLPPEPTAEELAADHDIDGGAKNEGAVVCLLVLLVAMGPFGWPLRKAAGFLVFAECLDEFGHLRLPFSDHRVRRQYVLLVMLSLSAAWSHHHQQQQQHRDGDGG